MRVLLVDDDSLLRRALSRRISSYAAADVTVDEATGVAAARALLDAERYDVIISDERMPDGFGHGLLALAAELQPHARRALMSGTEPPAQADAGAFERFFTKSDGLADLTAWVLGQAR